MTSSDMKYLSQSPDSEETETSYFLQAGAAVFVVLGSQENRVLTLWFLRGLCFPGLMLHSLSSWLLVISSELLV